MLHAGVGLGKGRGGQFLAVDRSAFGVAGCGLADSLALPRTGCVTLASDLPFCSSVSLSGA